MKTSHVAIMYQAITRDIPDIVLSFPVTTQTYDFTSQAEGLQRELLKIEDGVGSSCSSIHLCGSLSGSCWYCVGVGLEHTLQGWLSLGSYQQKSHLQCMFLSSLTLFAFFLGDYGVPDFQSLTWSFLLNLSSIGIWFINLSQILRN